MEKYTSQEPMTFKKKLENFWFYHKYKVLVGILILCMLLIGIRSCVNRESIDMYALMMVNGAYSGDTNEELAKKLEQYVEDIDGDGEKRVQIIAISFSDVLNRTDRAQEATLSKMVAQVSSGPALFYIVDDENYKALKEAKVQIFDEIEKFVPASDTVETDRYNATASGFTEGLIGFDGEEDDLYFGVRTSDGIGEDDSRFAQIEQSHSTLNRIVQEYK